jgi:hypothetical protein
MSDSEPRNGEENQMKTTVLVLAIIAGVLGLIAGLLEITVGGGADALSDEEDATVTVLGFVTFALAVVGIVGGAIVGSHPRRAAILTLVAGIGGFITAGLFWILSGPLFLVASLLAFLGRRRVRPGREVAV